MDAIERAIAALQLLGLGRWPRRIAGYMLTPRSKEPSRLSAASRDESIAALQSVITDIEPILTSYDTPYDPSAYAAAKPEDFARLFRDSQSRISYKAEGNESTNSLTLKPIRAHGLVPFECTAAGHLVVVRLEDIEAGRLPRVPPPIFHYMYIRDLRVKFVLIFSEEEFQEWRSTVHFPPLYPYESSSLVDLDGEEWEMNKVDKGEKVQTVTKPADIVKSRTDLAEPGVPMITLSQTATQRAYETFGRVHLQQTLYVAKVENENGNRNGNGLGQDQVGDTNINNPVADQTENAADPPHVPNANPHTGEKPSFNPFAYPKSKIARRFVIKQCINEVRRKRRAEERFFKDV